MKLIKLRKQYIKIRSYVNKGLAEANSIRYFIQMYLLLGIWLKSQGYELSMFLILLIFFLALILFIGIGWLWDKMHLYHDENEFSNQRNDFVIEMRKKKNL